MRHSLVLLGLLIAASSLSSSACSSGPTVAGLDGGSGDLSATANADLTAAPLPDMPPGGDLASNCPDPVSSAGLLTLSDFEGAAIASSDTGPEGFRGSDVARGTILHPGAAGTNGAAQFSFATDNSIFFQGAVRPQYLDTSAVYHPDLANALDFYLRVPAGSSLLSGANPATFAIYSYHWKSGDPWVGPNAGGGNLTDSQMHGYALMRFTPDAADRWIHVVLTTSAFQQSRGNYHFYAARGVVEDLTFFGSLRQFQLVYLANRAAAPNTFDIDQLQLITLPPTAAVCPPSVAQAAPAAGGDVLVPIQLKNPTGRPRTYRAFISSEIGADRQVLETAMHDADDVSAIDNLQAAVGADGGLGAAELFAADSNGAPTGANVIGGGGILVPAGQTWHGVIVHHVTPGMLGALQSVSNAGHTYMIRRDTLTTSAIFWDPASVPVADAALVNTGSNADSSHPSPPGFPKPPTLPAGWTSSDVPVDQAGAFFVSILKLN